MYEIDAKRRRQGRAIERWRGGRRRGEEEEESVGWGVVEGLNREVMDGFGLFW